MWLLSCDSPVVHRCCSHCPAKANSRNWAKVHISSSLHPNYKLHPWTLLLYRLHFCRGRRRSHFLIMCSLSWLSVGPVRVSVSHWLRSEKCRVFFPPPPKNKHNFSPHSKRNSVTNLKILTFKQISSRLVQNSHVMILVADRFCAKYAKMCFSVLAGLKQNNSDVSGS